MAGSSGAPRISARGIVVDSEGSFVLIRRLRATGAAYLVTPGGRVEDGESFADAVRRECAEELGAVVSVGEVVLVASHDEPAPGGLQRFLLCRLDSIDDGARTGHEFREPGRGSYETVRIAPADPRLAELRPPEVADLIRHRHASLVSAAAALT